MTPLKKAIKPIIKAKEIDNIVKLTGIGKAPLKRSDSIC
jgi:hypothetical protein